MPKRKDSKPPKSNGLSGVFGEIASDGWRRSVG